MKLTTRLEGYADPKVNVLAGDVQSAFGRAVEGCIVYATAVWQEPFTLTIPPLYANEPVRKAKPAGLLCICAVNASDRSALTIPSVAAFDWLGNGKAQINAVSGLTPGIKYELTFLAVG